ncbi:MAG: hypothetical protein RL404_1143 [Pseudomonadota bacterium]
MSTRDDMLQRRLARETSARKQAEALLEQKSLELFLEAQERQQALDALRESQQQLAWQASHDALTGVHNRKALLERLEDILANASRHGFPVWVAFIDLDRFKYINDRYGHAIGDRLLVMLSARLREVLRREDLIGRYGGDEFILVLQGDARHELSTQAIDRIMAAICEPLSFDGFVLNITSSVGIAAFPSDGDQPSMLIERADAAMYRAKESGRNVCQFYNAEIHARVQERALIESTLPPALADKQLMLHYQPQLSLADGKLVGAEALIRWQHPELGLLLPDRFIPLAGESRLINRIGAWALNEACQQCAGWHRAGLGRLRIAVNLSLRQLNGLELITLVDQALAASGLPADCLELELTESLMMTNIELTLETLRALHERGVKVALDDFGTGYSSFAYLKQLPLSCLKVDREFVRDLGDDSAGDSEVIVRSLIQLAHNLGLRVIAEGVETSAQLAMLCALGCDEMQGWLYSQALPAVDFDAVAREHRDEDWRPCATIGIHASLRAAV